jgi:hypothetical protein
VKTYSVTLSGKDVPFGLFMYGGDNAPAREDVRAALKRCGLSDKAILRMTWSVSAVARSDFGVGRIGVNRDR